MKVLFVSLGCDKNLADSEAMLALLTRQGHEITNQEEEAEVVVINTCCFIHDAKEESIQTILELAERKETGRLQGIIVAGCLAERYQKEIEEELPEVDVLVGTASWEHIAEAVEDVANGRRGRYFEPLEHLPDNQGKRRRSGIGFSSYLKIAEGCDKHCTYCVIPSVRGPYRSIPMERLIQEAEYLAKEGVKELLIVAQETTLYGVDLYGKKCLPDLLRKLCQIPELTWIRVLYCYPEEITDELIQVIKEEEKVCHYLDIPIQHASDAVLKRMGRKTTKQELADRIRRLRSEIPDIVLRTTLITGFPGETEEEFAELFHFVDEMEFEHLGVFPYSLEEGTPAASLGNQVPEEIKEERRDKIVALQQEITAMQAEERIGEEYQILIEGLIPEEQQEGTPEEVERLCEEEGDLYVGRSYLDAPEIDGYLFVRSRRALMSGDSVVVRVIGASEYDLYGELIEETTKPEGGGRL